MGEYKRLKVLEAEKKYGDKDEINGNWKKFELIGEGKEEGVINDISFSPTEKKICAFAFGTKIKFFDVKSKELAHSYGGFKEIVRSVAFRKDGRLFIGGDNGGCIRIIKTENREALRRIKAHNSAIYFCCFSSNKTHVLSASDDSSVKYWDASDGSCISTFNEHSDFVRTAAFSNSENIFASGSYDGSIKLWDLRNDNQKSVLTLTHGTAVECINFFSNGLLLVSAGGNEAKVWDITSSGRLVCNIKNHLHTITSAVVTNDSSTIITSSLDKSIKWNSVQTCEVLRSIACQNNPNKLAIDEDLLAVGLVNGSWFIRRDKNYEGESDPSKKRKALSLESFKYFTEKKNELKPEQLIITKDLLGKPPKKIDDLLRNFSYQKAADYAFTLPPRYVYSVMDELIQRGGLEVALRGKTEKTVIPILKFLAKQIGKTNDFHNILLETLNTLLEVNPWLYTCKNKVVAEYFKRINQKLAFEINQTNIMFEIQGILELIEAI